MRLRAVLVLVSVVGLCLASAPAAASEWGLDKWVKHESAWKDHGIGSSITKTTTVPMPKMPPNMPDLPGMKDGKMVTVEKTTLSKITKDGYVLTVETTMTGRTVKTTRTEPKARSINIQGQIKDAGEEALTVEGTSYTCKVKTAENMSMIMGDAVPAGPKGMPGGSPTMGKGKIWEHPKHGVLKMETSTTMMGHTATMTWQVSRLSVAHTVGKQSFTCREMTMTMKTQAGTSKTTMLDTRSVPGGTLKSVTENNMMGRRMTITTVLTAYEKKPLAATTPAAK